MALKNKSDFHANQEPSMTDSSKSALSLISTHKGYSESEPVSYTHLTLPTKLEV